MNTILKIQKRTSPYVMVDKSIFEDSKISWKAKGLMGYFLSRPDNWQIHLRDLYNRATDGYDSVKSGLKELRNFGYVQLVCNRNEKGTIIEWVYVVYEIPLNAKSLQAKPLEEYPLMDERLKEDIPPVEKPLMADPLEVNPLHNNNDLNIKEFTKNEYNNQSVSLESRNNISSISNRSNKPEYVQSTKEKIENQIGYSELRKKYCSDTAIIDEIVLNMLDMFYSESVTISGDKKPQAVIRSILGKIGYWNIDYIIERFTVYTEPIKNKKHFMQSMIYNSALEMDIHYKNLVNVT